MHTLHEQSIKVLRNVRGGRSGLQALFKVLLSTFMVASLESANCCNFFASQSAGAPGDPCEDARQEFIVLVLMRFLPNRDDFVGIGRFSAVKRMILVPKY